MAKRKTGSQIANLTPDHWKSEIALISLHTGGMLHTVGKFLKRVTTFLQTSLQSKVCTQIYEPPKLWEFQFWKFRDSHLGVSGQNDIWMLVSWPSIENTIRGKVVASPKSGPWWILWVCVCMWFIRAPKVFQLCTSQLVIWFV
jgi:hypothetical protein